MSVARAEDTADQVAAIDLGSNSFHMVVARVEGTGLKVMDRLREPVRLAAGLGGNKRLTPEAMERALACLERFGQRVRELPPGSVRAVGTNTLRKAKDRRGFLAAAGRALGHDVEVVSGYEEARLIYLGVAHSLADDEDRRLVMDIGGGSTELIIGERFAPRLMESLHMGCVSVTQEFFADGAITAKRMARAELAAQRELEPVAERFRELGWSGAVGASGTIRAIDRTLRENGWSDGAIGPDGLERLRKALIAAGHVDRLNLKGLGGERAQVIPGGFAVLSGAFRQLDLERLDAADGALREGLLYDLLGRIRHEDVRSASVVGLARRYHADAAQAARVETTAGYLLAQVADDWGLQGQARGRILAWAAQLHEVGLDISHSQYHKHGAYIVGWSDLAGFSRDEQQVLATLVRAHRRKFPLGQFRDLPGGWADTAMRLAVLLRLAVVLHRGRSPNPLPAVTLRARESELALAFPAGWLDRHPLARADLEEEAAYLANAGFALTLS